MMVCKGCPNILVGLIMVIQKRDINPNLKQWSTAHSADPSSTTADLRETWGGHHMGNELRLHNQRKDGEIQNNKAIN